MKRQKNEKPESWADWTHDLRLIYVLAYDAGLISAFVRFAQELKDRETISREEALDSILAIIKGFGLGLTSYDKVIQALDEIYQEKANTVIPLPYTIPRICQKLRGELTEEEFKEKLRELQQVFAEEDRKSEGALLH